MSKCFWNNGTKRLAQCNIDTNLPFVKKRKKNIVSVKHNKESVEKNLPANARDIESMASVYGSGRSLEEEMATRSLILAWIIPWTEEPDRLQSMGSQSVRHD